MSRSQPVQAGEWLDSVIVTVRRVFGLMLAIGPITWLFTRQTCYSVLISVGYRFRVFGVSVAGTEVFALPYQRFIRYQVLPVLMPLFILMPGFLSRQEKLHGFFLASLTRVLPSDFSNCNFFHNLQRNSRFSLAVIFFVMK